MLFRGTLLAYATHLNESIDKINKLPPDAEVEETGPTTVDMLELFYKMCDKEDIPKPLAKKYKVLALDMLGVM
jgi:hypothetical protein